MELFQEMRRPEQKGRPWAGQGGQKKWIWLRPAVADRARVEDLDLGDFAIHFEQDRLVKIQQNTQLREDVREKENLCALEKRSLFNEKQRLAQLRAKQLEKERRELKKLRKLKGVEKGQQIVNVRKEANHIDEMKFQQAQERFEKEKARVQKLQEEKAKAEAEAEAER